MARLLISREHADHVLSELLRPGTELAAQADLSERWSGWDDWLQRYAMWRDNTIAKLRTVYVEGDTIAFDDIQI